MLQLSGRSKERYGDFRIDVYRDRADALQDAVPPKTRPNREGIYWNWSAPEHKGDRSLWLAVKLYDNAALFWWNPRKSTDSRWKRLDSILGDLVGKGDR
jgi:hypothetical protein